MLGVGVDQPLEVPGGPVQIFRPPRKLAQLLQKLCRSEQRLGRARACTVLASHLLEAACSIEPTVAIWAPGGVGAERAGAA